MALVRWRPSEDVFPSFFNLREEINRMFDDFLGRRPAREVEHATWYPAVDISETENEIILRAEIPGVKKDDIHVSVENNTLTFSGEKKIETEEKNREYHRAECCYGRFTRSFTLPATVDADKVKATYKEGVLTLALPKVEAAKPKRIAIEG